MIEITAGQKYRSAHRNVVMTVVKPSNGKYGVHVDPSDDPGHVGAYNLGVFEKMVADGDMILIEEIAVIDATPAETIALLNDVATAQDALNLETAQHMVDSMLTARGRTPESIAYVARAALRMMLAANPGDEITTLALAELERRHPAACVTVEGEFGTGLRWHLVDRDGNPVEAGEYTAKWSGRPRFTIAEHPEIQGWTSSGVPICVWVEWVDVTRGYCEPGELVDGWNWAAERV